ncbi:hypothetical protein DPMN_126978 [Dreissena polymorpha]|uniref:Uncharacterized protein n=1 Tax=Dreissena polymorpha TaxID=45954 RepID=A0A9D4H0G2_DREPO|nr:hypothetical protein DPMN_126978 [Dreissena polymorpha]
MSSCADVFIELLSTKNKLLSADTWMMQPWDVELTDDSNRAEQSRKRRRRFKKRNIAEKVNGTCKQVPTVNKDFSCCETTQQKCFLLLDVDNKAPLWKQQNKQLYCKTSSNSKAPEHATQYKKCQFANLDVDTE